MRWARRYATLSKEVREFVRAQRKVISPCLEHRTCPAVLSTTADNFSTTTDSCLSIAVRTDVVIQPRALPPCASTVLIKKTASAGNESTLADPADSLPARVGSRCRTCHGSVTLLTTWPPFQHRISASAPCQQAQQPRRQAACTLMVGEGWLGSECPLPAW